MLIRGIAGLLGCWLEASIPDLVDARAALRQMIELSKSASERLGKSTPCPLGPPWW